MRGGTYLVMEGPQFSTRAESELYRSWGCDVIGMTNMPEAKLAREAEICYATVAMVTDYDCWHPHHDDVTVESVIAVLLLENAERARTLGAPTPPRCCATRDQQCHAGCHKPPWTTRSSPRPTRATPRSPRRSTRWPDGCWGDSGASGRPSRRPSGPPQDERTL